MLIRDTVLAVAATVIAGCALAAPAMAQNYRPVYDHGFAPAYGPTYGHPYGFGFGYGFRRPVFEGRRAWFHQDGYGDVYRHAYGYRGW